MKTNELTEVCPKCHGKYGNVDECPTCGGKGSIPFRSAEQRYGGTPNYRLAEKIHARITEWMAQGVRFRPTDIYLILQAEGAPMTRDSILEEIRVAREVTFPPTSARK